MLAFAAISSDFASPLVLAAVAFATILLVVSYLLRRTPRRRANRLANATVLIIRHAEKPASGRVLNREGRVHAHAYAHYFAPFQYAGESLAIDTLIAGADSKRSIRPRLTLEPLSRATGIAIDASFSTNDSPAVAKSLRKASRGKVILICWRHNQMSGLIRALGADPAQLLPGGRWPGEVYDWVLLLRYDAQGKPAIQQCIRQPDLLHPSAIPGSGVSPPSTADSFFPLADGLDTK